MPDRKTMVQRLTVALAAIGSLIPLADARAQAGGPPTIAVLERVQADVRIQRAAITLTGIADQPLLKADLVRTGMGARATVRFIDGSRLTLGEVAEAMLDDYAMRARRSGTMFVDIIKGAFLFQSGVMGAMADNRVEIRTPVANLMLRDEAEIWGGPIDGGHGIIVLSGIVVARNDAGSVVLNQVRYGTMLSTLTDPPDRPKMWGKDKLGRATAMVSFK